MTSRTDAYFGNNHVFNATVFNETKQWWTAPLVTAEMLANGKVARQLSSKAHNPTYVFTLTTEEFSLGEVVAPVIAFGDVEEITVNRTLMEYFFGMCDLVYSHRRCAWKKNIEKGRRGKEKSEIGVS